MFYSTKKLGPISTCHRNWHAERNTNRDSRKCALIHGYSRYIEFAFQGDLDEFSWVYDFGDCGVIKQWLADNWDHKVLIAGNDPQLDEIVRMHDLNIIHATIIPTDERGWGPGIEGSCMWVYDVINPLIVEKTNGRVSINSVRIWEHEQNTAIYQP